MSGTHRKICVLGLAGLLALGGGLSAGCSTTRVGGAARMQSGDQLAPQASSEGAGGWDAVMPGEYLTTSSDEADLARRDAGLNVQPGPGPMLASTEWPHAPQPLFERPRRVQLPRDPSSVLQFLPGRTYTPRSYYYYTR